MESTEEFIDRRFDETNKNNNTTPKSSKNRSERNFLLKLFKDSINKAVNISTKQQCMIEDGDLEPEIVRVLNLFEIILCHGLIKKNDSLNKTVSSIFSVFKKQTDLAEEVLSHPTIDQINDQSFWTVIEKISKSSQNIPAYTDSSSLGNLLSVYDTIQQVSVLTKNNSLKCRFLLRFLMMKKESHLLLDLIKLNAIEFYDDEKSLLHSEDCFDELYGLLQSLTAVDVEFCLKPESESNLKSQDSYVSWFLSPSYLAIDLEVDALESDKFSEKVNSDLVNQKSYLEQENQVLQSKVLQKNNEIENLKKELESFKTMNLALESSLNKFKDDVEETQKKRDLDREEIDSVKELLRVETSSKIQFENELKETADKVNDLEMALKILERDVQDKRDLISDMKSENDDLKVVKDELYGNFQSEKTSATQLMVSNDELRAALTRVRKSLENLENEHEKLEINHDVKLKELSSLKGQLEQLGKLKDSVATDLEVERDWREKLQKELNKHKDLTKELVKSNQNIVELEGRLNVQKEEKDEALSRINELEQSLSELGQKFEDQVVTADEVKDYVMNSVGKSGGGWVKDELVDFCKGCDAKFTLSRRKHHCRRCGDIFCAKCSSGVKKLTEGSKRAVRVCDDCVLEIG